MGEDWVLELFHGPTSAFKDVALQILPRFMARTAPADGGADEKIMIVTATSGDTGKAALAGFADAPGTGITVFYPQGKVSQVQELQMTTQTGSNVTVCAVEGNFDDAQSAVKRIFGDRDLAARLARDAHVRLSSANSINVGRLVPQVVYYFSAYVQLVERGVMVLGETRWSSGRPATSATSWRYYGEPPACLVEYPRTVASDRNNVLFEFLTTGNENRLLSVRLDHLPLDGYLYLLNPEAQDRTTCPRRRCSASDHADELNECVDGDPDQTPRIRLCLRSGLGLMMFKGGGEPIRHRCG